MIALRMVEEEEKEVKDCLKQCAGITFKLQNKMLSDGELR